jgi:FixJ family two-component response regulator
MESAATVFEKDPSSAARPFGEKPDSMFDSENLPIVFLIAGGISGQKLLKSLVAREGCRFETFESAREFLARPRTLVPSCIVFALSPEQNHLEERRLTTFQFLTQLASITGHLDAVLTNIQG